MNSLDMSLKNSNSNRSHNEEFEKDESSQEHVQQVVKRLTIAYKEIQRLTDELQEKEKAQSKLDFAFETSQLEIKKLKESLTKLKEKDSVDLQKAKEHNQRLDEEILALRNRVRLLDSDKKVLGEVVERLKGEICEYQENKLLGKHSPGRTVAIKWREEISILGPELSAI